LPGLRVAAGRFDLASPLPAAQAGLVVALPLPLPQGPAIVGLILLTGLLPMRKPALSFLSLAVLGLVLSRWPQPVTPFDTPALQPQSSLGREMLPSVAHAGGGLNGETYTNSLDALDANRDQYDLFEIDLSVTSDGKLVCLHDWQESFTSRFGFAIEAPIALAEFEKRLQDNGLQNCTLDTLAEWLVRNPGKRIVTDVKDENLAALTTIATLFPDLVPRFVPQAYQPNEIGQIRALGYEQVFWTLYRFSGGQDEIIRHLHKAPVEALVMPETFALTGLGREVEQATGIKSYVHTVNNPVAAGCYADLGISGVYTDTLGGSFPAARPGDACRSLVSDP
jgi:hypothetical protein